MLPTVYDICIKDVATISINNTIADAIAKMSKLDVRTLVVRNKDKYHIISTSLLIDFRLKGINSKTKLSAVTIPYARSVEKDLSILNILNQISSTSDYMVILDENKDIIGIVSYTDIINNVDPKILMQKQSIGALILNYKASFVYENSSTIEAVKLIRKNKIDSVIIKNSQEKHIGIFTTKDFVDLMSSDKELDAPVSKYMSSPLETLSQDETISNALDFIKEKHFKRLVIVNELDEVVGIISQKELLRVVYNKWIDIIKKEGTKISKTNEELLKTKSKLEEKASLDFLTQIYNRQRFETFLDYEIKKHSRYEDATFSIFIVDLDYFKDINDNYGHLKGDYILQEIAKILKLTSRETDIVARWGGEEFIVLLPYTQIDDALLVAEKLRSTVEGHDYGDVDDVTCSIGVAHSHHNDTKDTIFERADKALYKAKELGRNRVEIETLKKLKV